jgi:hypothetical protein
MKIRRYMQRIFVSPLFHPYQKRKAPNFLEALSLLPWSHPLLHFITDGQAGLPACGGINLSPRVENDKTSACAEVFVTTLWSHLDSNQGPPDYESGALTS